MIEAYVSGLAFDTLSNAPVVLLHEHNGKRILPIWIGPNEAGAIALELSGIAYRRPLTHDLMKSVLKGFNARLLKIVVSSLEENTFFAKFYIQASENEIIEIDARPSDSIAMALKMKAPIYISEELGDSMIELSQESNKPEDDDSISPTDLKKRLRNINTDDFGDFNL